MNFGYPKLFTDIPISVNSDYLNVMLAIVFYTFDPKIQKFAKGF